jgi:hypothetical protein
MQLVVGRLWVEAQTISIHLPDTTATVGNQFEVPVYVDNTLTGQGVYSYQLQLEYPAYYLQVVSVSTTGCLSESFGQPTVNKAIAGKVTIAAAGVSALSGSGKLLTIRFKALQTNYWTNVSLIGANSYFNETHPTITTSTAYFHLEAAPYIYMQTSGNLLFVGETVQNYAYYGQDPYTWSVTNPELASINSDGVLTGLKAGFTRVIATDARGICDTSDAAIEIRDVKISMPDTSSIQGSTISIPVYVNNLSNNDIYSGSFTINYSTYYYNFINAINTNTLLSNTSFSANGSTAGKVLVSFASATPIGKNGVLIYLNFKLSNSNVSYDYLRITNVLFNENILAVNRDGLLAINSMPYIYTYPQNGNILVGESVQLKTEGNYTLPITWKLSDNTIASIDTNGILTGLKSGLVTITSVDAVGAVSQPNQFRVYNARVRTSDTTICAIPQTFLYPVFVETKAAIAPVFSAQGSVSFDSERMSFMGIETNGTLSSAWTYTTNAGNGTVAFAGSGSSSFNTSGTLVFLKFQLNENFTPGSYAYVHLQNFMLNEGNPTCANDVSGSISGVQFILYTSDNQTICQGSSTELFAWGANQYTWQPATEFSSENGSTVMVSPSTSTQYIVNGSIGACKQTDTVYVTVIQPPQVSAGNNVSVCNGSSLQLVATGDGEVWWSGFENDTINITPSYTEYYTAFASNSCGTNSDTVLVEVLPTPWVSAGNDIYLCLGQSTVLQAFGEGFVSWIGSENDSINVSPSATSAYIATANNSCGTVSDTVWVFVNTSLPTISAGSDQSICYGQSVLLQASGTGDIFWNEIGENNTEVSPAQTTTYIATAVTGCGSATDSMTIEVKPLPYVWPGDNQNICQGNEVQLITSGEGNVSWVGFENDTINVSPTVTTTYHAIASNSCGTVSDSTTVYVNALPSVSAGDDVSICQGQSINLQAVGTGTVYWQNYSSNVIDVSPTLSTYYIAIAENICGTVSDSLKVTVNPLPIINLSPDQSVCYGNSATIGTTQQENRTYTWKSEPYAEYPQTSFIEVKPLKTTLYTLTVADIATNCAADSSTTITVNELPFLKLNNVSVVSGDSTMLSAGINQYYSYLWTSITPTGFQSALPEPVVKPATNTLYILQVINTLTQCSNTDSMWVYVTTKPHLGDVDYNGEIQAFDAAISLQYSVGLDPISGIDARPWSEWRITSADVDGNKAIEANDASLILRYVVGLITAFPAQTASKSTGLADVKVSYNGNNITISSLGGVYALNVWIDNAAQFDEPVFKQGELTAFNASDNIYRAALCAKYPIDNQLDIIQIPIKEVGANNITVHCIVNNVAKDFILNPVGIDNETLEHIAVYPNPASEKLNITGNQLVNSKIDIYTLDGKKLPVSIHYVDNKYEIDITQLPDGMYVMHIISDNGTSRFLKFIKQKR